MRADQALELLDRLLWTAFLVSAPILIACLLVGLLISVLQVATQLQEMTLSYVPKLLFAGPHLGRAGAVDDRPDHAVRDRRLQADPDA